MLLELKWNRPTDVPYPNVWHRFLAKDLNSDELVEYRIEDLTEDRFDAAFQNMKENFILDEPQFQSRNAIDEENMVEEYCEVMRAISRNRMTLVCVKEGSDEIIGVNWNYVLTKGDAFDKQLRQNVICFDKKILFLWEIFYFITKP